MTREKPKRIRRQPDVAKTQILDMTERLMLEEGYASISTRRVAKELGITGAAIHHYFPTTDDLFIELHNRTTEQQLERFLQIANCDDPLTAMWEVQSSGKAGILGVEFLAAANHRKAIRERIINSSEEARRQQAAALERYLDGSGISPSGATAIIMAVARMLTNEGAIGISFGHGEARAIMERMLAWVRSMDRTS